MIATRQQIGNSLDKLKRRRDASKTRTDELREGFSASETSDLESGSDEPPYDDSFIGVAKEIIDEEGVTGLWLGIQPGLVLTANPAITYGCYERVKSALLLAQEKTTGKLNTKLSPWMTFAIGAISKTLATIVRGLDHSVGLGSSNVFTLGHISLYYGQDPYTSPLG